MSNCDCLPPGFPESIRNLSRDDLAALVRAGRDDSIGYLISMAHRLQVQMLQERLKAHGITIAQWYALVELWCGDGLTQKDLAERIVLAPATVTRTLDRMERDGLVRRERSSEDRRAVHVYLTERAIALLEVLPPKVMEVRDMSVEGIAEEDLDHLRTVLRKIIDNISKPKAGEGAVSDG